MVKQSTIWNGRWETVVISSAVSKNPIALICTRDDLIGRMLPIALQRPKTWNVKNWRDVASCLPQTTQSNQVVQYPYLLEGVLPISFLRIETTHMTNIVSNMKRLRISRRYYLLWRDLQLLPSRDSSADVEPFDTGLLIWWGETVQDQPE